ncbi:TerB family tellurite resistance protein [Simiduia agarivorans]|uniref:Co-chaperone DjlA N-terminal domain-containing protein n=1 Tax=Simiduia agarivorans (strain DSM 21679 / JCM 13881 / BCRC 17597 / SA1) TaxID=1117647 RepID=K4L3Q2_SIMAS|nr:TerB family tellurite resistance protein [Simiduia agarivorans]AFV00833.1 hypothetical protein M5M_18520 [Simiduia agarivorans SA1 = DSM 21679]
MIVDLLKQLFDTPAIEAKPCHQLAAIALLVEVGMADGHLDEAETASLCRAIERTFGLSPAETKAMIERARQAQSDAVSHFEFTRVINAEFEPEQKFELVLAMWQLAYADGNLDRYEEHTIRKLAELMYLPHSEFIRAKVLARE